MIEQIEKLREVEYWQNHKLSKQVGEARLVYEYQKFVNIIKPEKINAFISCTSTDDV